MLIILWLKSTQIWKIECMITWYKLSYFEVNLPWFKSCEVLATLIQVVRVMTKITVALCFSNILIWKKKKIDKKIKKLKKKKKTWEKDTIYKRTIIQTGWSLKHNVDSTICISGQVDNLYIGPEKKKKKKKKRLFGCHPPPAPNFWKLEKSFYGTKVYRP